MTQLRKLSLLEALANVVPSYTHAILTQIVV